jgi:hypothetical protein
VVIPSGPFLMNQIRPPPRPDELRVSRTKFDANSEMRIDLTKQADILGCRAVAQQMTLRKQGLMEVYRCTSHKRNHVQV